MSKYIIKNCEQIHSSDNFCWSKNIPCQDCTDCVMKQIVELCKEELKGQYSDTWSLVQKISKLLDIEEVE